MKRLHEIQKFWALAFDELRWTCHFYKPGAIGSLKYRAKDPGRFRRVLRRLEIDQIGRSIVHLSTLDHLRELIFVQRFQLELSSPAIEI